MITIVLNGETTQVESDCNIEQLLQKLNIENQRLAVEINQEIIPRSEFASQTFSDMDKVEICLLYTSDAADEVSPV